MQKLICLFAACVTWVGWAGPATATWVGAGDRANLCDPANWECKDSDGNVVADAIPTTDSTAVTVSGSTSFNCPLGTNTIWKSIAIGSVTLTADCDWRGVGDFTTFINASSTIELAGHNLQVKAPNGTISRRINVTDSSAKGSGGEFHLYVPTGHFGNQAGWNNDNVVWYSGSVKFVKDGAGSYCPNYANGNTGNRYYQYTGGTVIHEGLVYLANDGEGTKNETYYAQNTRPLFGPLNCGSPITIDAGGTLNYKGIYDIGGHYYPFVLNGGTLACDRAVKYPDYGGIMHVQLLADSNFNFTRPAHVLGPWSLNDHTLSVSLASGATFYCRAGTISNGTVKVTGAGEFQSYNTAIIATNNVTLDIASPLNLVQPITAQNYISRYEGSANAGTATFTVTGTFTPVTTNFYPITLAGRPTINLATRSDLFSTTGTSGTLKYAADTIVTIDMGDRTLTSGDQVLAWKEVPDGVLFRIVGSKIYTNESPTVDASGVYYDLGDLAKPALAHWTGLGAHNDFTDPANWICTNGVGEVVANGVPGAQTTVYFNRVNFDITDETAFRAQLANYKAYQFGPAFTLTGACDWRGIDLTGDLLTGRSVDLQGSNLTLGAFNGTSTRALSVTDTAATGGRLILDVPEGATFVNTTIALSGTAALGKAGAGLMIQKIFGNTYTGGTWISAGTLRLYNDDVADSGTWSPRTDRSGKWVLGVTPSRVTIEPEGTIDINGVYDVCNYVWNFAGGRLVNSKKQTQYTYGAIGNVQLEADSTFDLALSTVFRGGSAWNLGGHTLTVKIGAQTFISGITVTNGTLAVVGSATADFAYACTFADATLDLNAPEWMSQSVTVSNLVARYASPYGNSSGYFIVTGRFTPVADRYHNTQVKDGVTLDLSQQSSTWNTVSATGSLSYDAACSNLVVDTGAREIALDTQLVTWTSIPAGVTFTLTGEQLAAGGELASTATGLFYVAPGSTLVVAAEWTGAGEANNINDPANWSCFNALGESVPNGVPGKVARVRLVGSIGNVVATTAAASPWQQCVVGSITLTEDLDLRAFGAYTSFFETSSTIDLKGHKLFVQAPSGTVATAFTITDSTTDTENPGELHLAVPSGTTFTNTGTTLAGNLRFVKEGAGTFSPAVYKLDYYGGNVVAEGGLTLYNPLAAEKTDYAFRQKYQNPLGRYNTVPVRIDTGAWLDMNGVYDASCHHWQLNGGTIQNTKAVSHTDWGGLGNVTLTTNSTVNAGATFFINAAVDFGGHTLAVQVGSGVHFYMRSGPFTNGTLDLRSGGYLDIPVALDMRTVDIHQTGAALSVNGTWSVRDYYAGYGADWDTGSGAMNVYGTFTPAVDTFHGCVLQDGATLNLSTRTGVWDSASKITQTSVSNVTFAADATITVDLGTREFDFTDAEALKVVAWTPANVPAETTHFRGTPAMMQLGRSFIKREDGLYLYRSGLIIIVR